MSRQKLGGTAPAPYKYSTRRYVDHNLDQLKNKIGYLKADVKALTKEIKCIIEFLENSPHANAFQIFRESY